MNTHVSQESERVGTDRREKKRDFLNVWAPTTSALLNYNLHTNNTRCLFRQLAAVEVMVTKNYLYSGFITRKLEIQFKMAQPLQPCIPQGRHSLPICLEWHPDTVYYKTTFSNTSSF